MPGFASGGTGSSSIALSGESGSIGTTSFLLTDEEDPEVVFTAVQKTKLVSILLTNATNGTLPVDFYIKKDGVATPLLIARGVRVHKRRFALQALVSGDTRITEPLVGDSLTLTEMVLAPNDQLLAKCPYANAVTVHATYYAGVE